MKTKKAFCANCQEITEQAVSVDNNGEYLFECECGRFIKFPADVDIKEALKRHEEVNKGQISQAEIDKANEEKLANI